MTRKCFNCSKDAIHVDYFSTFIHFHWCGGESCKAVMERRKAFHWQAMKDAEREIRYHDGGRMALLLSTPEEAQSELVRRWKY